VQVCIWSRMCCQMCAYLLKTFWRSGILTKTAEDARFRGNKWLHVFSPPYMCAWSIYLYVESLTLFKSVRQESAVVSLWCTNNSLQSLVAWLKGYFSQKLPKREIVRFLRVLASFAKLSLSPGCGAWCDHIRIQTWTP
jgi:hypothetical protein